MHKNIGFKIEEEFVRALDGKAAGELSHNIKHMLREMFDFFEPDSIVECQLVDKFQKPDIYIELEGKRKYISLKHGQSKQVGQDKIKNFILWLREQGLSVESQKTILLFQFCDGTMDGSGRRRMKWDDFMMQNKKRLDALNKELNSSKSFIKEFANRYVFKGTVEANIEADYIYHGDINYGVSVSKTQLFKHIERRSYDWVHNPHVGPFYFKPHARYSDGKPIANEHQRWKVDIIWANMGPDIDYIAERYDG
ncbi:MAG: hypothetical protein MJ238_01295 [Bacilli bacterium]|nr:hypothetical protein [Bacilli bacterium]